MSLEFANYDHPEVSGCIRESISDSFFSPEDYLLGIAKNAVSARHNIRITLPGKGDIVLLPEYGEYHSNIPEPEMTEFCRKDASLFNTTHLTSKDVSSLRATSTAGNIKNLMWQAGFYASQGRLVESRSHREPVHEFDIIQFTQWPNLSRLPTTPNTMRIFALLTRHPSAIMLIHRKLHLDPQEVYQVYSAACAAGFVNVVSNHLGHVEINATEYAQPIKARSILGLLFTKIASL